MLNQNSGATAPAPSQPVQLANQGNVMPLQSRVEAPMNAAPRAADEHSSSLFDRSKYLQVDPKRDLLTTVLPVGNTSVDATLVLDEGGTVSGTHYGLRIVSRSGVLLIAQDAKLYPSKKRGCHVIGAKTIIAGEVQAEVIHGEEMVGLASKSKVVVDDIRYGQNYAVSETALLVIKGSQRPLGEKSPKIAQYAERCLADIKDMALPIDGVIADLEHDEDKLLPKGA